MTDSTMIRPGFFVLITNCGFAKSKMFLKKYAAKVHQTNIPASALLTCKDEFLKIQGLTAEMFDNAAELLDSADDPIQGHLRMYDVTLLSAHERSNFVSLAEKSNDECGFSVTLIEDGITVKKLAAFIIDNT